MRRYLSVLFTVLMVAGLATTAGAALTFDVDFWTNASDRLGPGDLGGTFNLIPGEQINVDIYFSTGDLNITSGSIDLQFDPAAAVALSISAGPQPSPTTFWAGFLPEITPGSAKGQAYVFDPVSTAGSVTGDDILFTTVLLECIGPVNTQAVLANYLGFFSIEGGLTPIDIGSQNLGTLNQVPIPGTIWLLGAGLAGLVGIRRNRRK